MTPKVELTKANARRLAVNCQHLNQLERGFSDSSQVINALGYVQLDTIHIVERTQHHTFGNRFAEYRPGMLDEMLSEKRQVFEYWGHAMSYLPMEDFRWYLPNMDKAAEPHSKWEKERLKNFGHLMEPVLERIRNEGPLGVKDFPAPEKPIISRWGGRKPEKVALEMLLWRGQLMVTRRDKFHRIYDLTDRVLPGGIDTSMPSAVEQAEFLVRRALKSYGAASAREIENHIIAGKRDLIEDALVHLVQNGEVVEVKIADARSNGDFALAEMLETREIQSLDENSISFLSPFDNLIIQRERTKRLFDYDYKLECYTPIKQRRWGYFVFSILWGDELVGRFDPRADRKKKLLEVSGLQFEKGFDRLTEIKPLLRQRLSEFAQFNGCENYKILSTVPASLRI